MADVTVSNPFLENTGSDRTALLMIVTIVCSILMLMTITAKNILRSKTAIAWQSFEIFLHFGVILLVTQTVLIILMTVSGLGKHVSDNTTSQNELILKYQYASSILAVAAISCTKASMCLLMKHVNGYGRAGTGSRILQWIIVISSALGVLAAAFQCALPRPWDTRNAKECTSARVFYLYNGAVSVLTDMLLCGLAIAMIWDVKTDAKRKATVVALFSTRMLCPIFTILSLLRTDFLYENTDFTWLAVDPTVWRQIAYNLAVITACIPTIKPIFDGLSGTMTAAAIDAPYQLTALTNKSGFEATPLSPHSSVRDSRRASRITGHGHALWLSPATQNMASCYTGLRLDRSTESSGEELDDQSESIRKLTTGGVIVKKEVEVDYESIHGSPSAELPQTVADNF